MNNYPLNAIDPTGMSMVPCQSPASVACVGNDPDFATSTNPYDPFAWISDWLYSWQRLHSGGGTGGGSTGTSGGSGTGNPPKTGNTAQAVTQTCLAQYNNSTAGKAIQFFSVYNLATNFKQAGLTGLYFQP